jgi:aspartyl aminopeptidase
MRRKKIVEDLIQLLKNSGSPFHTVEWCEGKLQEAGFSPLSWKHMMMPTLGGKFYIKPYKSMLIAFTMGAKRNFIQKIRMAAAHTDQPCFRVKPSPEMTEHGYLKVNVETYGSPILSTWMDRPLSLAGKVVLKSDQVFSPKVQLFDSKAPIAVIPNLAIHMNRDVNKGVELNRQKDMLPVLSLLSDQWNKDQFFLQYLARELKVEVDEILDFDLYFYNADEPTLVGLDQELISSPRLDNLVSVAALVDGLIKGDRKEGMNLIALFDHEEVGSQSKQGAGGNLIEMVLRSIFMSNGMLEGQYMESMAHSMCISVDGGHAIHPNAPEKCDPTNQGALGSGVMLKISGNQKYATDSEVIGAMKQLMEKWSVKYHTGVNRSDVAGGSTVGPILSSTLPIPGCDIGLPMLAMHSSRELAAVSDYEELKKCMQAYFTEK